MVTQLGTPEEPSQSGQWALKAPRPNGPVTSSVPMELIFSFQLPTRLNWQATHSHLLLQPRRICSLIRTRQSEHKHSVVRMKGLLFSVWHRQRDWSEPTKRSRSTKKLLEHLAPCHLRNMKRPAAHRTQSYGCSLSITGGFCSCFLECLPPYTAP